MKKEKRVENHNHNDYSNMFGNMFGMNPLKILECIMLFCLIFVTVSNWNHTLQEQMTKNEDVYEDCVDACSKKYWKGTTNYLEEWDRTECLQNCNEMYLAIRSYEVMVIPALEINWVGKE